VLKKILLLFEGSGLKKILLLFEGSGLKKIKHYSLKQVFGKSSIPLHQVG